MVTLQEVRATQERQLERLRKLQHEQKIAPPERKPAIQQEIDLLDKDIRNLDTIVQELINEAKTKRH
jgi:hypothetical protein